MARFLLRDPAIQADPVARADPGRADPVAGAELRADTMAQADPPPGGPGGPPGGHGGAGGPADQADLQAHPADPANPVTRAAPRAHPADHGTGMRSVATSTGPRGATDPHLGDPAHRRGPTGAGRFLRPVGDGSMARSTTGATRKRPCGIPGSTSGDSGSSGFGSRCKDEAQFTRRPFRRLARRASCMPGARSSAAHSVDTLYTSRVKLRATAESLRRTGEIVMNARRFVAIVAVGLLVASCGSARAAGPHTIT